MRYILRKFLDADTVQEAIRMDRKTPVHDCYLKEGESPKSETMPSLIGFCAPVLDDGVPYEMRKRREKR